MKNKFYLTIASGFGLGFLKKAPGTFGSLLGIPFYFVLQANPDIYLYAIIAIFFIGVFTSSKVCLETDQKDPCFIVIDEVVGFMIASWFLPFSIPNLLAVFILFRLFDILKPWPIKKLEAFRGGWGIMLDDVAAGIFAWLVVRGILIFGA